MNYFQAQRLFDVLHEPFLKQNKAKPDQTTGVLHGFCLFVYFMCNEICIFNKKLFLTDKYMHINPYTHTCAYIHTLECTYTHTHVLTHT